MLLPAGNEVIVIKSAEGGGQDYAHPLLSVALLTILSSL